MLEPTGKKGEKGEGFEVLKSGDARVAMIGFPSVGKVCIFHMNFMCMYDHDKNVFPILSSFSPHY